MKKLVTLSFILACVAGCSKSSTPVEHEEQAPKMEGKAVVYQMFTRLFGNENTTNKPWGTVEENGVGKFADIDETALGAIKDLGVTHVWYTGVLHHAVINDYPEIGLTSDDPDVVKGRAGSPYAIKDYYNVNPDLAIDTTQRLREFEDLIARTHAHGMKVIIDIVPNHIARDYQSAETPEGVEDFGITDDTSVEYARDNNFYYVVGQPFEVPVSENGYQPLGGEPHSLSDGKFIENPAKWTGNGSRLAQPKFNDWYETVKINYGIRPDGSKDFPELPEGYDVQNAEAHYQFWQGKSVPSSWIKFREIAEFWIERGVDGFRFDMAEMVPVEFWSYLNSHIKHHRPDFFLLAEIYNPAEYRNYIHLGKMDYLYDKVEMYDGLKDIIHGKKTTDVIETVQAGMEDIEHHMLHFLENHDEQRIASEPFAGYPERAKPAMVVSTLISSSPTMLYFGQDVGERGDVESGFGDPTRTSIFDYAGVPAHQRWMNGGKFDGGLLSDSEKALQNFYRELLTLSISKSVMNGEYLSLHSLNKNSEGYSGNVFSFARWCEKCTGRPMVVVSNFSEDQTQEIELAIPETLVARWNLAKEKVNTVDVLTTGSAPVVGSMSKNQLTLRITLQPLESRAIELY